MYRRLFSEFLTNSDTLQVFEGSQSIFSSNKDRVIPLLEYVEYIGRFASGHRQTVIFYKIMGNAAALLSVKAGCQQVYGPLGSQLAVRTLDRYGIKYRFPIREVFIFGHFRHFKFIIFLKMICKNQLIQKILGQQISVLC